LIIAPGDIMSSTVIEMKTTFGVITLELDAEKAPKTVENFVRYATDGFYDGTIFHRVIDNFMIQGGGFDADMQQKESGEPIENEADNGLKNDRGTIAMARTMDPHSATAQFFLNVKDNDFLNHSGKNMQGWGYTVFGKVTAGDDVLDKIRSVETGNKSGHQDVPKDSIVIESVTVTAA
jgi:peptidyl-prolyl cis-trans isomerase B (cyclophilin B)